MSRLWNLMLPAALAAALGCGAPAATRDPRLIEGFDPPARRSGEMEIVGDPIRNIAPGSDVTLCTYLDLRFTEETDVTNFRVFQSGSGHHAIVYAARRERPVDTHPCTEDDMVNARMVAPGAGESLGRTDFLEIPAGLSFRIPAGSQIFVQSHWINASQRPADGQVVAYLSTQPASSARAPLDLFNVVATNFKIPAGQKATYTTICPIMKQVSLYTFTGHAHEIGTRVDVEHVDSGGTAKMLWAHDWEPEYQSNPPLNIYAVDKPLVFQPGDKVKVTCTWDNVHGAKDILFPREMCVGSGFYFPGKGEITCLEGNWSEDP